jgi:cytochrome c
MRDSRWRRRQELLKMPHAKWARAALRWVALVALVLPGSLWAGFSRASEAAAGNALYVDRCGRCHGMTTRSARAPARLVPVVMLPLGPNLTGVYGRPAGAVAGYRYSDAFRAVAADLTWDDHTLDRWLADSRAMIPGTYMLVRIAPAERAAIIAYLKANTSR